MVLVSGHLYQSTPRLKDMPRVNTDEILKDFGDWKNPQDLFKAGKMAVSRISDYFSKGITFNQETTLCGKAILKNIKKAKELGYFVELHYVGVDNVDIAKERVRHIVCRKVDTVFLKQILREGISKHFNNLI